MATVTIDIKEYDLLRKHDAEFNKIWEENIVLRDSSRVIIKTIKRPRVISVIKGVIDEGEYIEEFVNFDDVKEKVEKQLCKKMCDLEEQNNNLKTQNYDNLRNIKLLQEELKSKQEELDRIHINYKGVLDNIKTKLSFVFNSLDHKFIRHTKELQELDNIINGI